ncbi:MAG TPA: SLC13 family permease, partial [Saprospiraceae bacterium]|nr:SLC13 family permease [Saprospiraceae bacterium]
TATAVMMTPVAIAVSTASQRGANFNKALLLGVGYACSIGGLATTIGTPTNAIFLSYAQQKLGMTVSLGEWLVFGLPLALGLLLACWGLLLWLFPLRGNGAAAVAAADAGALQERAILRQQYDALGPITAPERRLMWVFGTVIAAWVSGSLLWYKWIPNCTDTVVAMAGAILLFLLPAGQAGKPRQPLLDWSTAVTIPWGVILFFGGGLALAKCFDISGLAAWMGQQMEGLGSLPYALILLTVLSVVVLLSEVASNIATASMMMPVLAALAVSIGADQKEMLLCAALAASIGFGLPVATAPNTIVFSSGYISTRDMAKAGFLLDIVSVLMIAALAFVLL